MLNTKSSELHFSFQVGNIYNNLKKPTTRKKRAALEKKNCHHQVKHRMNGASNRSLPHTPTPIGRYSGMITDDSDEEDSLAYPTTTATTNDEWIAVYGRALENKTD